MTKRIILFLLMCLAPTTTSYKVAAQGFDIVDQFRNTISLVQTGIDDLLDTKTLQGTQLRLGLAIGTTPDYPGSNNYSFRALPLITVKYKDKWEMDNGHFTYNLYKNGNWTVGPLISSNFGREERQNRILRGLGDIGDTVDLGVFIKYNNLKTGTLLDTRWRHGLSKGQAFRVEMTLAQAFYKKDNLLMLAGFRAKYFDETTMQTNYGITEEQAANSEYGFDAFKADSGFSEAMAALVAMREFPKQRMRLMGVLSYGRILGNANDSPLVSGGPAVGGASQVIFGTALTFSF